MGYEDQMVYDYHSVLNDNYHTLTLVTPIVRDGGGGGTTDYDNLTNKPAINGVTLRGNQSLERLGIQPAGNYPNSPLTDEDLEELLRDEI